MPNEQSLLSAQDAAEHVATLQSELARLRDELEHTQRLATIGVIAAGIAHEINNILTPVLAYAQLAMSNPADAKLQSKAIERTVNGVQTVTQVAEAMLGFASTSKQTDTAHIHETITAAFDCIGRDPAKDRIQVTIKVPQHLTVSIRPLALQQVLMNLILNAIEALRPTGGSLTIRASECSDGTTRIEVADNGPGIPDDLAGRLFEPFAHSSHVAGRIHAGGGAATGGSHARRGTGLGLSICRRLIESAGGTITASSSPNRGTTFTMTIPSSREVRAKAG